MYAPEDLIEEWIYEELEKHGMKGTIEEYDQVVRELPEFVGRNGINQIVTRLFGKTPSPKSKHEV